ncbi:hypothetical protein BDF19DRAFT_263123 [Syncephalis fuscata]|nr:hypothetical protein BDF19DRAFT_263123 [Syncephalis fuscata]
MRMPYTNLLVTWIFMGFLFTILLFLSGVLLWTIIAPTHYLNHQADIYLAPQIAAIVLIIIFTYFSK